MADSRSPKFEAEFVGQLTECQLPLLMYVRSLLPGDPAVRDVAQQANAKIWEMRADFELGTNFKAWAFTVARYEVLNHRKRQAVDSRLVFSDELARTIAHELSTQPDVMQQRHEALKDCLTKLRSRDRELLLHRYSDCGTLADFATSVGRSISGLKVTLHRLRSTLLKCIQRRTASWESSL